MAKPATEIPIIMAGCLYQLEVGWKNGPSVVLVVVPFLPARKRQNKYLDRKYVGKEITKWQTRDTAAMVVDTM